MKIYKANILHTPTPQAFEILAGGYVIVGNNGYIIAVSQTLPEMFSSAEITDFGDALLIPAMNDMHVHAPQYRNMGIAIDMELLPWLNNYTFPEEARFQDCDYAQAVYRHFVHDLWANGTMRSSVFATCHLEPTKILADIFHDAGMGAYIGLVGMDRNCPDNLYNTAEQAEQDTLLLETHTALMPLVKTIVTPRFVPSCTPDMLRRLGQIAQDYQLPVQSHLSENRSEIAWVRELEPESTCYGDAYNRYGLFGQTPTLMAHCCYTDGEEMQMMREKDVIAVHCPTSNCNLGSGVAPVRTFLQNGIKVVLGSDVAAGHTLSMFRVMQYALQMSKLQYARSEGAMPFLTLPEVFYMATKAAGAFFGDVGSFEQGKAFDALVIDDSDINYPIPNSNYTLQQRLERYIYLGDSRHITHRFCNGKEIKEL